MFILKSVATIVSEVYEDLLGVSVGTRYYYVQGTLKRCNECSRVFLTVRKKQQIKIVEE